MSARVDFQRFLRGNFSILIAGRRKSGKSALMYRLAEIAYTLRPRPIYVVNLPVSVATLLPEWIRPLHRSQIDKVTDSILLFEESALVAFSRSWYSSFNKLLSKLNAIAYHKRQSHIYVVQNMSLLDRNVISLIDVLMLKDYNYVQYKLEREELREIVGTAAVMLRQISAQERVKYAVVIGLYDYPPFLFEYRLPSFWREELAYAWEKYSFESERAEAVTLTEQIEQIISEGKAKSWRDLKPYFPQAKDQTLRVLFRRVKKRLAET
jgi:hypothetical protein